jgi:GTP-binding protein HflX
MHVVDGASPERHAQIGQVQEVLTEIGAEHIGQITVFNKIDLTGEPPRIEHDDQGRVARVFLSARTGAGVELLLEAIADHFRRTRVVRELLLPTHAGRLRAAIYEHLHVVSEQVGDDGSARLTIELSEADLAWLQHQSDFQTGMLLPEPAHVLARTGS